MHLRFITHPGEFTDRLAAGQGLAAAWLNLGAVMACGAALYGLVLGMWHGTILTLYVGIKLPLVLLLTSALTMIFNFVLAAASGLSLRFGQVAVLTFLGLAAASLLLASLAPVAWLFTISAPEPSESARYAHNLLYLFHTAAVGICGLAGCRVIWRALARTCPGHPRLRRVFFSWIVIYALVGGEVAWALRPFVGSVYFPVEFLRADALRGNVYEFIFTDIFPYLTSVPPAGAPR